MAKDKRIRRQRGDYRYRESLLIRINIILAAAIVLVSFGIALREIRSRNRVDPGSLRVPDWVQEDLIVINPHSRAGEKLEYVNDIVIHYVANPMTSAKQNRDYFNNQAFLEEKPENPSSSHFVIDIDGTIIQCVPLGEVAFANYPRNYDTISIECCHPDETGEFTAATKESLLRLTSWLCGELELGEKHILRHYDVSTWKKPCPKYYVDHEDEWIKLRKEIIRYRK